jgi:antitoxin FitA
MGWLFIRDLDDAVIDALRRRAKAHGQSLEEEARQALSASAGLTKEQALERIDAIRAKIGRLPGPSIVEELRLDRARDEAE